MYIKRQWLVTFIWKIKKFRIFTIKFFSSVLKCFKYGIQECWKVWTYLTTPNAHLNKFYGFTQKRYNLWHILLSPIFCRRRSIHKHWRRSRFRSHPRVDCRRQFESLRRRQPFRIQKETSAQQDDLYHLPAARAREGLREEPLPRRVLQGRART